MKLIVGLGNPSRKYEKTRHNLGFAVLDALLQKLAPVEKTEWQEIRKLRSKIFRLKSRAILAKPQTMMNNSGIAVKKLTRRYFEQSEKQGSPTKGGSSYSLDARRLWVIHDDLDLLLGKIKIVQGRGAAGHKGVESVIKELGTDEFVRFRLGIGRPEHKFSEQEAETFVLSPFGKGERSKARGLIKKTVKAIEMALEEGIERAMSRFNQ